MSKAFGFLASLLLLLSLASAVPAQADLADEQNANWGLADFGTSNSVGRFSALGWSVEEAGGRMFVGGNFLNVTNGDRTESQPYLAAFHVNTGSWDDSFNIEVERPVLTMESTPDGGLVLGGEIRTYNGQNVGSMVKIDPATGELWPGWTTRVWGGTNVVRELSLEPDGWLYATGTFKNATDSGPGTAVSNVIRMDPNTGIIDRSWLPSIVGGAVWGVSASRTNSTVYLAGWFTAAAGVATPAIGLDTNDASSVTWSGFQMNYPCCGNMYDVEATEFGTVFLVGEQHASYIYDEGQDMAVITSHVTSHNSDYQESAARQGGDFQEIERVGDRIYATCHCWGSHMSFEGAHQLNRWNLALSSGTHTGRVSSIIAYDVQSGVRDQSFNPYMAGDVGGFGVKGASDGCLWVTGGINAVGEPGDQKPGRDLVRLCDENDVTPPVVGPASCAATVSGGTIEVEWDAVDATEDYVVYRSVDDGPRSWRAKVGDTNYLDTNRSGEIGYYVLAIARDGTRSEATECDTQTPVEPDLSGPAACTAVVGAESIEVNWSGAQGASEYIVYRSVDGGRSWWRGKTENLTFNDSGRDGELTYTVLAVSPEGVRSTSTECTSTEPPPPAVPTPVAACTVTPNGADPTQVTVGWSAAANVDQYVIFRSIANGPQFWRGRTAGASFDDVLRGGETTYYVSSKLGNEFSERVACQ